MLLGVFDIYILSPMSLRKWFGVYVEPSKIIAHGTDCTQRKGFLQNCPVWYLTFDDVISLASLV